MANYKFKSVKSRRKTYGGKFKTPVETRARSLASKYRKKGKAAPKKNATDNEVISWYRNRNPRPAAYPTATKGSISGKNPTVHTQEQGKQYRLKVKKDLSNKSKEQISAETHARYGSGKQPRPQDGKTVYLHEGNRDTWNSINAPKTLKGTVNREYKLFEEKRQAVVMKLRRKASEAPFKDIRLKYEQMALQAKNAKNPFPKWKATKAKIQESIGPGFYDMGTLRGGKGSAHVGDYVRAKDAGIVPRDNTGLFDEANQGMWSRKAFERPGSDDFRSGLDNFFDSIDI